jgi:hypothetical protein
MIFYYSTSLTEGFIGIVCRQPDIDEKTPNLIGILLINDSNGKGVCGFPIFVSSITLRAYASKMLISDIYLAKEVSFLPRALENEENVHLDDRVAEAG